jgi:putative membrane protein
MRLLLRWLVSAAAVWVAVRIVPGISIEEGITPLLLVSLILGGVNTIVRPILSFLACGLILLTLGLFLLVINAAMLLLAARIAQAFGIAFFVDGFWPALFGSLVISVVSYIASTVLGPEPSREG